MGSNPRPRVLLVAFSFALPGGDPWLIDDLATALARRGALVDVLVHDVSNVRPRGAQRSELEAVRVFSVGPMWQTRWPPMRILSYVITACRLHTYGIRSIGDARYDIGVYFSPAVLSGGLPARLRRLKRVGRLIFVLWDFFPVHHVEIGRIGNNAIARPLKWLERISIRRADAIAVMTDRNAEYLASYHPGLSAEILIVPPWGGIGATVSSLFPKYNVFTVVFGGQLTAGRGIETVLACAELLQRRQGERQNILIIGSGPDRHRLQSLAADRNLENVTFVDRMERSEYLDLICRAHVGLAVTVPNVTVPTFPSKIVDYFRAGLPAIVCLERSSDVGAMIEVAGAGLAVEAGNADAIADSIGQLQREWKDGILNVREEKARAFYREKLSAISAAEKILG